MVTTAGLIGATSGGLVGAVALIIWCYIFLSHLKVEPKWKWYPKVDSTHDERIILRYKKSVLSLSLLIPVWSITSYIGLFTPHEIIFLEIWRVLFEAFAVFIMMRVLLSLLGGTEKAVDRICDLPAQKFYAVPPLCCCFYPCCWESTMTPKRLRAIQFGIMQYGYVKVLVVFLSITLYLCGVYDPGNISFDQAYPYLRIIDLASFLSGQFCLSVFFHATKGFLHHLHAPAKYLWLIGIAIFSSLQTFVVSLIEFDFETEQELDDEDKTRIFNNWLFCLESVFIAFLFSRAFSISDYDLLLEEHQPVLDKKHKQPSYQNSINPDQAPLLDNQL